MLPIISGGHPTYQHTFVSDFLIYYPNPFALSKNIWDIIIEFWYLDLSLIDILMQDCYSKYGPEPRLPSFMLRSYLLSIKLKITAIVNVTITNLREPVKPPDTRNPPPSLRLEAGDLQLG